MSGTCAAAPPACVLRVATPRQDNCSAGLCDRVLAHIARIRSPVSIPRLPYRPFGLNGRHANSDLRRAQRHSLHLKTCYAARPDHGRTFVCVSRQREPARFGPVPGMHETVVNTSPSWALMTRSNREYFFARPCSSIRCAFRCCPLDGRSTPRIAGGVRTFVSTLLATRARNPARSLPAGHCR